MSQESCDDVVCEVLIAAGSTTMALEALMADTSARPVNGGARPKFYDLIINYTEADPSAVVVVVYAVYARALA